MIATSVWLLGAAVIHVSEMVGAGNYNPGNAGVVFYMDIIGPLFLMVLLAYSRYAGRERAGLSGGGRIRRTTPVACSYRGRGMKTGLSTQARGVNL